MKVLGISCFYHDSAACLVVDGEVVAAAEEERFSREKHDNSFPSGAIDYCLESQDLSPGDLDKVVFYEKPVQKFDRLLNTAADVFPRGYKFFSYALPDWVSTKLRIIKKLRKDAGYTGEVEFLEHHHSHAASAFYPSPFKEAAVLTVDGVGEWKTNQTWIGRDGELEPVEHIDFPDSVGLLYSTITAFLGFMVNNGEYKVMGLASYGEPKYRAEFEEIIEVNNDGSYRLNQEYFRYRSTRKMWSDKMEELLGEPREDGELTQRHKDIAATLQDLLEEVLLKQIEHLYEKTDTENLCMAGGVALNSAANGKIVEESSFENIWIQPAAGDDGGSLGAAMERSDEKKQMEDVYLGPEYPEDEIREELEKTDLEFEKMEESELVEEAARRLESGEVVAVFRGRMEWGPRALGNRSILADPRNADVRDKINEKVKFREGFRPFAPSVLEDHAPKYFDIEGESPYMLFVYDVKDDKKDVIPGVTHVNGTSRIQTVKEETNPFYYSLIDSFNQKTGVPVVLNTSFNLKGMPIVRTPENAVDCFKRSGIDALVIGDFLVE